MFKRKIAGLVATALIANCLLFALYRIAFLWRFADPAPWGEWGRVLLYGLRLDLALLGFELALVSALTLLLRSFSLRRLTLSLWGFAALHAFLCLANFFTFAERNQNSGDLILPYITSPYQVYLALMPFCRQHWLLLTLLLALTAVYLRLGVIIARRLHHGSEVVDLWRGRKPLGMAMLAFTLPMLLTLQPLVKQKREASNSGLTVAFANSKFFTHFPDYRKNEAVINPLYEFVGVQIPTAFNRGLPYRLTETRDLDEWRRDCGECQYSRFPFVRGVRGEELSGIENVVIIQVEGLSGSVLQQERNGKKVTPFLSKLAREEAYFPNTFQNANFTSGGVFSTASGVPKGTWEEPTRRFASHELRGYYGSLAHILGSENYTHYFCQGFRQSGDDFLAFMSYQGCKVLNYEAFRERLAARKQLADADSLLGIHDGYMMQETADILEECPTRFTAHLMTCSTHSPWKTPDSFGSPFKEVDMNTFAYLDASIEAFARRIGDSPKLRGKTLIVVLGDHTSVTFGNNPMERLRIPLFFFVPGQPRISADGAQWAQQVDVVPSVLGLLQGDHHYGGTGRNLFDPATRFSGVPSGTRDTGYFITEDWLLRYHPFGGAPELFAVTEGEASLDDVAASHPDELTRLQDRCSSRMELAKRLSLAKRIWPTPPDRSSLGIH